ncbi:hypothetical protein NJ76_29220 [Rhodococcus sp. IITR03]|nr:hypothetical protein NJ76_29220 [Rhodococcus sp. IITR03]
MPVGDQQFVGRTADRVQASRHGWVRVTARSQSCLDGLERGTHPLAESWLGDGGQDRSPGGAAFLDGAGMDQRDLERLVVPVFDLVGFLGGQLLEQSVVLGEEHLVLMLPGIGQMLPEHQREDH